MRKPSPKKSPSFIISPPYPLITTPQSPDSNSPPPLNYNLHITPSKNLSPRHFQLPSLFPPPCIHSFISPEDTTFDISSKDSRILKV